MKKKPKKAIKHKCIRCDEEMREVKDIRFFDKMLFSHMVPGLRCKNCGHEELDLVPLEQ